MCRRSHRPVFQQFPQTTFGELLCSAGELLVDPGFGEGGSFYRFPFGTSRLSMSWLSSRILGCHRQQFPKPPFGADAASLIGGIVRHRAGDAVRPAPAGPRHKDQQSGISHPPFSAAPTASFRATSATAKSFRTSVIFLSERARHSPSRTEDLQLTTQAFAPAHRL